MSNDVGFMQAGCFCGTCTPNSFEVLSTGGVNVQSGSKKKKKSRMSSPWNGSSQSASGAGAQRGSNGSNQHLVLTEDHMQCISRRHRPYFKQLSVAMETAAAADDDTSSVGTDENEPARAPSSTALPSPESRQLPAQTELTRDASVFSNGGAAGDPRPWRGGRVRGRGASAERPGLSRLISDMSDASNSTTSTFVAGTPTPSQSGSGLELTERP